MPICGIHATVQRAQSYWNNLGQKVHILIRAQPNYCKEGRRTKQTLSKKTVFPTIYSCCELCYLTKNAVFVLPKYSQQKS